MQGRRSRLCPPYDLCEKEHLDENRSQALGSIDAHFVPAQPSLPGHAQDYPVKEITTVCPFAAGTGADITVRYFSAKLAEVLGKTVIVLNKPGATGNIASETVARAKPDGYTISITPASSTMAAAPYLYKKLPFDPVKDFTPVTTLASLPFVLVVDGKKPIHPVADLITHLKARNGDSTAAPTIPASSPPSCSRPPPGSRRNASATRNIAIP